MESVSQGGGRESKENHSLDEQVEIPGTLLLFCCLCEHWICLHRERACSQQLSRNSPRAGPLSTYVPGPCCARSRLHLVQCLSQPVGRFCPHLSGRGGSAAAWCLWLMRRQRFGTQLSRARPLPLSSGPRAHQPLEQPPSICMAFG